MELERTTWHHAPEHRFLPGFTYMITGATLYKRHFYSTSQRLEMLQTSLLELIGQYGWVLIAWAVFSNHYHLIAQAMEHAWSTRRLTQRLHAKFGLALNLEDGTPGRRVWYQYWDKCLTYPRSYYARLNYVANNPVRHGLVAQASDYPFCSAASMEREWSSSFLRKVQSAKYDKVRETDDFDPIWQR